MRSRKKSVSLHPLRPVGVTFWILVSTLNVILQVTLRSEISITSSLPLSKSWSLMIKNGYWRCML